MRRVSLAVMAVSAPLPAAGVALSGSGALWAVLPAAAGTVTVATMRAKRVPTATAIPAPAQYPARLAVEAQVLPGPARQAGPDLNVLRALVAAETPGRGSV